MPLFCVIENKRSIGFDIFGEIEIELQSVFFAETVDRRLI